MRVNRALVLLVLAAGCEIKEIEDTGEPGTTDPVDSDGDGFSVDEDCDDSSAAINPSASEICDGVDNDCDDLVDDQDDSLDASTGGAFYGDNDQDGYGADDVTVQACTAPDGFVGAGGDCNDDDPTLSPSASEVCDGEDNDCDDLVDEADDSLDAGTTITIYTDNDGDGFGDDATAQAVCFLGPDQVVLGGDCDDTLNTVYPTAAELCDGVDNDCDASTSEDGTASWWSATDGWSDWTSSLTASAGSVVSVDLLDAGTLYLCAGEWNLAISVENDVSIIAPEGPEATTIAGNGTSRIISIEANDIAVDVQGVGITGGTGAGSIFGYTLGGGVYCASNASVTLSDVDIFENSAGMGGGMMVLGCDVQVYSSSIRDNDASYACGGACLFAGALAIEDSLVSSNTASSGFGGGLLAYTYKSSTPSSLDIVDSIVESNSGYYGGGLYVESANASCTGSKGASNAGFLSNSGSYGGGVMLFGGTDTFTSSSCDYGTSTGGDDNSPVDIFLGRAYA